MKIFVTGATGFIGEEVCLGLRRAGHEVYALVRDEKKATTLMQNEVLVTVGDLEKPAGWLAVAKECEILIHTAADYSQFGKLDKLACDHLIAAAKSATTSGKKMLIYTSGVLVYGDRKTVQTEHDPVEPTGIVKDRVNHEQLVLRSTDVCGVVIRPAFVYGKKTTHFMHHFESALTKGKVVVTLPNVAWCEVHIDDLVDSYVRIVEAPQNVVRGEIFNVADSSHYTNLEIGTKFGAAVGCHNVEVDHKFVWEMGNKTVLVDSSKVRRAVGWVPKHPHMLEQLPIILSGWKGRNPIHAAAATKAAAAAAQAATK